MQAVKTAPTKGAAEFFEIIWLTAHGRAQVGRLGKPRPPQHAAF